METPATVAVSTDRYIPLHLLKKIEYDFIGEENNNRISGELIFIAVMVIGKKKQSL